MDPLYALFTVSLGLIIGSFINALSFRYHTGAGVGGRSRCMRCGHILGARDLVPVLSYALLRGRCRYCKTSIAFQYPIVEALAGLMGYATWALHPHPLAFLIATLVWSTLLFVIIYDLRHTVLPTGALFLLSAVGLLSVFVECADFCRLSHPTFLEFSAGPILGAPLLLLSLVSRGRWMGWGDGMLAVGLGWLLGLSQGLSALPIAFWGGSIAGLILVLYSRLRARKNGGYTQTLIFASLRFLSFIMPTKVQRALYKQRAEEYATAQTRPKLVSGYTMESAIPFAPFLAFGAFIAHAYSFDILALSFF